MMEKNHQQIIMMVILFDAYISCNPIAKVYSQNNDCLFLYYGIKFWLKKRSCVNFDNFLILFLWHMYMYYLWNN